MRTKKHDRYAANVADFCKQHKINPLDYMRIITIAERVQGIQDIHVIRRQNGVYIDPKEVKLFNRLVEQVGEIAEKYDLTITWKIGQDFIVECNGFRLNHPTYKKS